MQNSRNTSEGSSRVDTIRTLPEGTVLRCVDVLACQMNLYRENKPLFAEGSNTTSSGFHPVLSSIEKLQMSYFARVVTQIITFLDSQPAVSNVQYICRSRTYEHASALPNPALYANSATTNGRRLSHKAKTFYNSIYGSDVSYTDNRLPPAQQAIMQSASPEELNAAAAAVNQSFSYTTMSMPSNKHQSVPTKPYTIILEPIPRNGDDLTPNSLTTREVVRYLQFTLALDVPEQTKVMTARTIYNKLKFSNLSDERQITTSPFPEFYKDMCDIAELQKEDNKAVFDLIKQVYELKSPNSPRLGEETDTEYMSRVKGIREDNDALYHEMIRELKQSVSLEPNSRKLSLIAALASKKLEAFRIVILLHVKLTDELIQSFADDITRYDDVMSNYDNNGGKEVTQSTRNLIQKQAAIKRMQANPDINNVNPQSGPNTGNMSISSQSNAYSLQNIIKQEVSPNRIAQLREMIDDCCKRGIADFNNVNILKNYIHRCGHSAASTKSFKDTFTMMNCLLRSRHIKSRQGFMATWSDIYNDGGVDNPLAKKMVTTLTPAYTGSERRNQDGCMTFTTTFLSYEVDSSILDTKNLFAGVPHVESSTDFLLTSSSGDNAMEDDEDDLEDTLKYDTMTLDKFFSNDTSQTIKEIHAHFNDYKRGNIDKRAYMDRLSSSISSNASTQRVDMTRLHQWIMIYDFDRLPKEIRNDVKDVVDRLSTKRKDVNFKYRLSEIFNPLDVNQLSNVKVLSSRQAANEHIMGSKFQNTDHIMFSAKEKRLHENSNLLCLSECIRANNGIDMCNFFKDSQHLAKLFSSDNGNQAMKAVLGAFERSKSNDVIDENSDISIALSAPPMVNNINGVSDTDFIHQYIASFFQNQKKALDPELICVMTKMVLAVYKQDPELMTTSAIMFDSGGKGKSFILLCITCLLIAGSCSEGGYSTQNSFNQQGISDVLNNMITSTHEVDGNQLFSDGTSKNDLYNKDGEPISYNENSTTKSVFADSKQTRVATIQTKNKNGMYSNTIQRTTELVRTILIGACNQTQWLNVAPQMKQRFIPIFVSTVVGLFNVNISMVNSAISTSPDRDRRIELLIKSRTHLFQIMIAQLEIGISAGYLPQVSHESASIFLKNVFKHIKRLELVPTVDRDIEKITQNQRVNAMLDSICNTHIFAKALGTTTFDLYRQRLGLFVNTSHCIRAIFDLRKLKTHNEIPLLYHLFTKSETIMKGIADNIDVVRFDLQTYVKLLAASNTSNSGGVTINRSDIVIDQSTVPHDILTRIHKGESIPPEIMINDVVDPSSVMFTTKIRGSKTHSMIQNFYMTDSIRKNIAKIQKDIQAMNDQLSSLLKANKNNVNISIDVSNLLANSSKNASLLSFLGEESRTQRLEHYYVGNTGTDNNNTPALAIEDNDTPNVRSNRYFSQSTAPSSLHDDDDLVDVDFDDIDTGTSLSMADGTAEPVSTDDDFGALDISTLSSLNPRSTDIRRSVVSSSTSTVAKKRHPKHTPKDTGAVSSRIEKLRYAICAAEMQLSALRGNVDYNYIAIGHPGQLLKSISETLCVDITAPNSFLVNANPELYAELCELPNALAIYDFLFTMNDRTIELEVPRISINRREGSQYFLTSDPNDIIKVSYVRKIENRWYMSLYAILNVMNLVGCEKRAIAAALNTKKEPDTIHIGKRMVKQYPDTFKTGYISETNASEYPRVARYPVLDESEHGNVWNGCSKEQVLNESDTLRTRSTFNNGLDFDDHTFGGDDSGVQVDVCDMSTDTLAVKEHMTKCYAHSKITYEQFITAVVRSNAFSSKDGINEDNDLDRSFFGDVLDDGLEHSSLENMLGMPRAYMDIVGGVYPRYPSFVHIHYAKEYPYLDNNVFNQPQSASTPPIEKPTLVESDGEHHTDLPFQAPLHYQDAVHMLASMCNDSDGELSDCDDYDDDDECDTIMDTSYQDPFTAPEGPSYDSSESMQDDNDSHGQGQLVAHTTVEDLVNMYVKRTVDVVSEERAELMKEHLEADIRTPAQNVSSSWSRNILEPELVLTAEELSFNSSVQPNLTEEQKIFWVGYKHPKYYEDHHNPTPLEKLREYMRMLIQCEWYSTCSDINSPDLSVKPKYSSIGEYIQNEDNYNTTVYDCVSVYSRYTGQAIGSVDDYIDDMNTSNGCIIGKSRNLMYNPFECPNRTYHIEFNNPYIHKCRIIGQSYDAYTYGSKTNPNVSSMLQMYSNMISGIQTIDVSYFEQKVHDRINNSRSLKTIMASGADIVVNLTSSRFNKSADSDTSSNNKQANTQTSQLGKVTRDMMLKKMSHNQHSRFEKQKKQRSNEHQQCHSSYSATTPYEDFEQVPQQVIPGSERVVVEEEEERSLGLTTPGQSDETYPPLSPLPRPGE